MASVKYYYYALHYDDIAVKTKLRFFYYKTPNNCDKKEYVIASTEVVNCLFYLG